MVEEPPQPGNCFCAAERQFTPKKGLLRGWLSRQNARVYQHEHRPVNSLRCAVGHRWSRRGLLAPGAPAQRRAGFKLLREVLQHGGPGYLQFAITNICNAKCDFCGFAVDRFDPKQRRSVTLQEARDVIDICVKNHIGYLLFVGGEPLVHKDLRAMTRYAAERGIHPMICTNGSLWTEQNMRDLAGDGLSSVIMSIDAHDVAKHEKNRGLPDVCRKIKRANEVFHELGVQTTASVTASKLIDDYDKLPAFLTELGFKSCTFSYPLSSLASSYLSFSDSSLVSYKTEELIQVFEQIKQMKRRSGFPVVNPAESLTEMQRHLRREPEKFGCLGGHKYFYLDWKLNLYRCHFWETPDVQHLRVRPVEAHPRRLHALHD